MLHATEWTHPMTRQLHRPVCTSINTGRKNILLVEDNEINIHVAKLLLLDCGYPDILIARNGQEALKLFSTKIALVLLDIGLPDMSGITICKHMRRLLKGKPLPIIAYTATGDLIQKECEQAGIDEILIKPVRFNEFKAMIQRYLKP